MDLKLTLLIGLGVLCVGWFLYSLKTSPILEEKPMGLCPVPDWTVDEARILRRFLDSDTGRMLMIRARAMEAGNAIRQCQDTMHTAHSAGTAKGFSDALQWLESLASNDTIQKLSGASADLDAMPTIGSQDDSQPVEIRRSF